MPKTATREAGADGRAGFRIRFSGDLAGAWAAYEFHIYERIAASAERFTGIAGLARSSVFQPKAVPDVRDLRTENASYWIEDAGSSLYDAYYDALPGPASPSFRYNPAAYVDLLDATLQRYRVLHMAGIVHLDVAFRNFVCRISPDGALLLAELRIIDFCDAVVRIDGAADGSAPHLVPPAPRFAGRAARPERNDDNLCRAIDALRAQSRDDLLNRLSVHVDLASVFATFRADHFEAVFAAVGPTFKQTFDAMRRFLIDDLQAQALSNGQSDDALMAYLLQPGARQATADIDRLYRQLGRYIYDLRQAVSADASASPEPPLKEASNRSFDPGPPVPGPHSTLRSVTPDSMSAFDVSADSVQPAKKSGTERDGGRGRGTTPPDAEPVTPAPSNADQHAVRVRPAPQPSSSQAGRPESPLSHRVKTALAVIGAGAALWLGRQTMGSLSSVSDANAVTDAQTPIPGQQVSPALVTPPAEPQLRIIAGSAAYRPGDPLTFTVDSETSCLLQVAVVDQQGNAQRLVPQNLGDEAFLLPGDRFQQHFPDSASGTFPVRLSPGFASLKASCSGVQGTETAEARIQIAQ